jgi:hypothetical protein
MTHRSSRGGMTCTPVSKQQDGQAITTHPNVWYMMPGYPRARAAKPRQDGFIPITRMILSDPASPLVGMTGIASIAHAATAVARLTAGAIGPKHDRGPGARVQLGCRGPPGRDPRQADRNMRVPAGRAFSREPPGAEVRAKAEPGLPRCPHTAQCSLTDSKTAGQVGEEQNPAPTTGPDPGNRRRQ